MKFPASIFLLFALSAACQGALANGHWRDRSPDDRQQIREQMREHWHQGGERPAYAPDRQGGPRWREMPPEDRRRLREEMRGRPAPDYVPERRPPGG